MFNEQVEKLILYKFITYIWYISDWVYCRTLLKHSSNEMKKKERKIRLLKISSKYSSVYN